VKRRATVVTENGRVVGVQFAAPKAVAGSPLARLRAGPGQVLQTIDLQVPAKRSSAEDIERFHVAVEARLRSRR
jgi:hypothetical protein